MNKRVILHRDRVNKQLEEALEYPLTMIVAPMGFGKTTAVKEFLQNIRGKHIWLTIHQDEESPQSLWRLMLDQIGRDNRRFAEQLNRLGFPADQLQQNKVFRLIEKYSKNEKRIFVFDDYQHMKSEAFNRFIEMLIRYRIPNVSLIIMSRKSLNMQVDDLELKGFCRIIDSEIWLMTKEEIKKFFSMYQVFPNKSMIDQIHERSEGWITAVCLLVHYYIRYGEFEFGSSLERLIENTIAMELSNDEFHMLLKLSVLDGFTLEQALYVVGEPLNRDKICYVCEYCGFIMYNHYTDEYRFQKMFRNYLNRRFETTFDQLAKNMIYQRSGEYLLMQGKRWSGLQHLLMAAAYEQILGVFEKTKSIEFMENNPKMVVAMFSAIPEELKLQFPIAYLKYIGFYLTHINQDDGKQMLKKVESYTNKKQNVPSDEWNWIQGEIEMVKSFLAFNDIVKMHEHHKKAFCWLQETSLHASKGRIASYGSVHLLYLYHKVPGRLYDTAKYIKNNYRNHESTIGGCGTGLTNQVMAEFYLETRDFKRAIIQASKAMCKAQQKKHMELVLCARFALIRGFIDRGTAEQVLDCMAKLKLERERCDRPMLMSSYDLAVGYISYILGDERGFSEWLRNEDISKSKVLYKGMGFEYIVRGQALLMRKDYIKLEVLVEEMMPVFRKFDHIFGYIHGFILDAIAKFHLYGLYAAVGSLESAFEYAKRDGMLLSICEYARDLHELLDQYERLNENDLFVRRLMQQMHNYSEHLKMMNDVFGSTVVLTVKEKEIMSLILEGKSNREIATELFVAEITVKKHVSAIYKKLNVRGRTLAVKKCLELNILSP